MAQKHTDHPPIAELEKTYGSFEQAVQSFFDTYHTLHGYKEIPDYLLGALVTRAKVVCDKRKKQSFLLFIPSNMTQIKLLSLYLGHIGIYPVRKGNPT